MKNNHIYDRIVKKLPSKPLGIRVSGQSLIPTKRQRDYDAMDRHAVRAAITDLNMRRISRV
jgi:hypothetical protein